MVIEGEEEWEVEKIMNKRKVQERDKYLVWWKKYTAEKDTWESRENLKNAMKLVEKFKKEYRREEENEVRRQEAEEIWQRVLEANRGKLKVVEEKSVLQI